MFIRKRTVEEQGVQAVIDKILREMADKSSDSKEFADMTKQLVKISSIQEKETLWGIKRDTLVVVAGNIIVVLAIVGFERTNVLTSRAMQFARQLK